MGEVGGGRGAIHTKNLKNPRNSKKPQKRPRLLPIYGSNMDGWTIK